MSYCVAFFKLDNSLISVLSPRRKVGLYAMAISI